MGKVYHIESQLTTVAAIKANDEHVLKKIYTENYRKTEVFILKNNGTMQQAKDTYQEAFIAMWQNIKGDRFSPKNESAVQGYLYQIAKNKWLDHLRSSRYKKTQIIGDGQQFKNETLEESAETSENEARLKTTMEAFSKLGNECRKLLKQFYFEKASLREIAEKLDIGEASARNKKYRCIQKLKEIALTPNR